MVNCRLAAEHVNFYLRLSPHFLFMSLKHDVSYLRVTKTCFKWNSSELISLNYHILPYTYWAKLTTTVCCSLNMYMYGNSGVEVYKHKFTLSVNPSVVQGGWLNVFSPLIFTTRFFNRHVQGVVTVSLTSISGCWWQNGSGATDSRWCNSDLKWGI